MEVLASRAQAPPPTRFGRSSRGSAIDLNAHPGEPTTPEQMRTFTAHTTAASAPHEVVQLLTDPDAIARWAPIPFEVLELDKQRLYPGANARVRGQLAGQCAEFSVHVLEVSEERLTLVAHGPVSLEVEYDVRPARRGSAIRASVSVFGHGLIGRLLAKATEALLAAGVLQTSLNRLADQPQTAVAA